MSSVAMDAPAPGCLVLLLQLSDSMKDEIPTHKGDCPKSYAVGLTVDFIIDDLVESSATRPNPLEICLVGFRVPDDGAPFMTSLLPDGETRPHFLPLEQLARMDVSSRQGAGMPRRWCGKFEPEGPAHPAAALAGAHWLLQRWLAEHRDAGPCVVIHCCDGLGLTPAYEHVAKSFALLSDVPPLLMHCVFTDGYSGRMRPTLYSGNLPEPLQRLWDASSPLPLAIPNCLGHVPRALTINEWPRHEVVEALAALMPSADALEAEPLELPAMEAVSPEPTESHDPNAETSEFPVVERLPSEAIDDPVKRVEESPLLPLFRHCSLKTQKRGNEPSEWEDAFHVDAERGAVAVSDGASEGIFCRQWSALLTQRWTTERPDLTDPAARNQWLNGCRSAWMEAINYPSTRITQRMKIDDLGAAATFLGFWVEPASATSSAERPWKAIAAGDSCLFWIRGQELLATFPLTLSEQFKQPPLLLRSKRVPSPAIGRAQGTCRNGDLFLLATDAVARWLLDQHGREPLDWERFETIDPVVWQEEIERLRHEDLMANDDCTLVTVRIGTTPERETQP